MSEKKYILNARCQAGKGIVAAISGYLAQADCYIHSLEQFDDDVTETFFLRSVFSLPNFPGVSVDTIESGFAPIAARYQLDVTIFDPDQLPKVMILVSQQDHCLEDLLYRRRKGELPMEITAVVSNHLDLKPIADAHQIPFHYLPVASETKPAQEQEFLELVEQTQTELVILARYMQILSDTVCDALEGRCINIHHSFLPGFKGAKAYHQAYERGVKYIGATAHYVNSDLDEGPIIEQIITRVNHNYRTSELVRLGRDNECIALSRAVKYHLERRVFLDGRKTVVFLGGHY